MHGELHKGDNHERVANLPSVEIGFTPNSLHQSAQLRRSKSRSQPTAEMSAKLLTADWSPRDVTGFDSVVRHEQRLQMWTATPNTSATLTVERRTGTRITTGLTRTKFNVTGSMSDTPPRKTSAVFGNPAHKTRQLDNDLLLPSVGCVLISLAQRSSPKSGTRGTW